MANTFHQIHIQVVFSVEGRANLIQKDWKEIIQKYIAGIINGKGQKSIIVNGSSDHVHCLFSMTPSMRLSDLVRDIKNSSSKFINEQSLVKEKFHWQDGYGAFSYSHSHLDKVYKYIENQEEHHRKKTFREEYLLFLKNYEIEHNGKYLFEWID